MTRELVIRPEADLNVAKEAEYLSRRDVAVGVRFQEAVARDFQFLLEAPFMGGVYETRKRALAGIRVWPTRGFENYLIFYRVTDQTLEIIDVLHGARNVQRLLRP